MAPLLPLTVTVPRGGQDKRKAMFHLYCLGIFRFQGEQEERDAEEEIRRRFLFSSDSRLLCSCVFKIRHLNKRILMAPRKEKKMQLDYCDSFIKWARSLWLWLVIGLLLCSTEIYVTKRSRGTVGSCCSFSSVMFDIYKLPLEHASIPAPAPPGSGEGWSQCGYRKKAPFIHLDAWTAAEEDDERRSYGGRRRRSWWNDDSDSFVRRR